MLAFEEALGKKAERLGVSKLSEEELVVLAIEALEREVNNGGYDQFFFNSPEFVPLVLGALNRIGCSEVAELAGKAIGCLGLPDSITEATVERVMEDDSDERDLRLEECDNQYYDIAGDLAGPLLRFIEEYKDKFVL